MKHQKRRLILSYFNLFENHIIKQKISKRKKTVDFWAMKILLCESCPSKNLRSVKQLSSHLKPMKGAEHDNGDVKITVVCGCDQPKRQKF